MAFPLPEAFLSRMQQLLPEKSEYEAFIQSYDKDHYQALRINPLKGDAGTLFSLAARLRLYHGAPQDFIIHRSCIRANPRITKPVPTTYRNRVRWHLLPI